MKKHAFWLGAVAAIVPFTQLSAQTASAGASDGDTGLQDIVVTAQRRSESLQRVPISVSAITASSALARGVTDTALLQTSVPGLDMSRQANGSTPFLRGVGATSSAVGNEPSVATYIDNVYISASQASIFSFNNIERVEVLRGPQGTLFGRNATGGVISVITKDPTHDTKLDANIGYGNFQTYSGAFYASTGLSDTIAVNVAAYGNDQRDGWGRDVVTNLPLFRSVDYGIRGKLLWDATDTTRVLLSADYNRSKTDQGVTLILAPGAVGLDGSTSLGPYTGQSEKKTFSIIRQYGTSLRVEQELDWASLVSISAYRKFSGGFEFDQDAIRLPIIDADIHQGGHQFSQELQLLSPKGSKLNWILGGFFFVDRQAYDPLALRNIYSIDSYERTRSFAGFGQATYEILPDTNITGGLRYTYDHRSVNGRLLDTTGALIPGSAASQEKNFKKVTYRASIDHHFGDNITTYVSFNRGFKSGLYNLLTYTNAPVKPEILDAFEAGIKSDLLDRRLRLNISGFRYNYKNIQVDQIVSGAVISVNAAKARIYGGEVELTVAPVKNFQVSSGLSFLHGRYLSFPNGPVFVPNPGSCDVNAALPGNQPGETGGPRTGGNLTCAADLSGKHTVHTPSVTVNVAVTWRIPTQIGDFDVNGSLYTNSGFDWDPANRIKQKAYNLANASVQWTEPNGHYYVRAWGKNLANTYYSAFSGTQALADTETPAPPRTYGLTLGFTM